MIIAQTNFRDEEYLVPKEIFEFNEFKVDTASKKVGSCKGVKGAEVQANLAISQVKLSDYDAVVLVGGAGALIYENDEKLLEMLKKAFAQDRLIAAICIAPRILGAAHILRNKNFTMWNDDGSQDDFTFESEGIYTAEDVEVDENLITADGPKSAKKFAETLLKQIK